MGIEYEVNFMELQYRVSGKFYCTEKEHQINLYYNSITRG